MLLRGVLLGGRKDDGRGAMPRGDKAATEVGEDCSERGDRAADAFLDEITPGIVAFLFVH